MKANTAKPKNDPCQSSIAFELVQLKLIPSYRQSNLPLAPGKKKKFRAPPYSAPFYNNIKKNYLIAKAQFQKHKVTIKF